MTSEERSHRDEKDMLATESTEYTEKLDKLHYASDGQDIRPAVGLPDTRQPTRRNLFGDSFVRFFKLFSVTSVSSVAINMNSLCSLWLKTEYEFSVAEQ